MRPIDWLIASGLALSSVLALTGGFWMDVSGVRIGVHDWTRPAVITTVLVGLRIWHGWPRGAASGVAAPVALASARVVLLAACLTSIGYWLVYLTTICGGSDSYGYVSASQFILRGQLIQPQDVATWLPVSDPLGVATPAGHTSAAAGTGIAPMYPLGFPALMALATILAGSVGPFLVPPVCAVVCLLLARQIGTTWYGPLAGWLAATFVAWDALFVTYAKQPMSDVPATMWTLLSILWLTKPSPWVLGAGVAAGASFVTRPGGLGVICVLTALAAWGSDGRTRRLAAFLTGLAPFVVFQALLQWRLYGSPLVSGYGAVAGLYTGATVLANLGIYLGAMWHAHSWVWIVGAAAAWFVPRRPGAGLAVSMLVVSAIPYLLYFQFDHWETLRFLMPAIVTLSIVSAGGIVSLADRIGPGWVAPAVATLCALVVAVQSERFLEQQDVPRLMDAEMRYPLTAEHIRRTTPPDAVVFAAQHSGSIRYYADRLTLRWDVIRPEEMEAAIAALAERGHPAYVALEGTEQKRFRDLFAEPLTRLHLYPHGVVRNVEVWELGR